MIPTDFALWVVKKPIIQDHSFFFNSTPSPSPAPPTPKLQMAWLWQKIALQVSPKVLIKSNELTLNCLTDCIYHVITYMCALSESSPWALQFPADLVTFTEEILNGKLHFLWSGGYLKVNGHVHCSDKISDYNESCLIPLESRPSHCNFNITTCVAVNLSAQ